jgi:hypothetical protein
MQKSLLLRDEKNQPVCYHIQKNSPQWFFLLHRYLSICIFRCLGFPSLLYLTWPKMYDSLTGEASPHAQGRHSCWCCSCPSMVPFQYFQTRGSVAVFVPANQITRVLNFCDSAYAWIAGMPTMILYGWYFCESNLLGYGFARIQHPDDLIHPRSLLSIQINTPQSCQKSTFELLCWRSSLKVWVNHFVRPSVGNHHFKPIDQVYLQVNSSVLEIKGSELYVKIWDKK